MGSITIVENVSLDGVVQAPGSPDEDTRDGFAHGGWFGPYPDAVLGEVMGRGMAGAGAGVFGRRTFESMQAAWAGTTDNPFGRVLDAKQKYVVSRGGDLSPTWAHTTVVAGDAARTVADLKSRSDLDLTVLGSPGLLATLLPAGLVDEAWLAVAPVVLGSGRTLFPAGAHLRWELVESVPTTTGVVLSHYRLADRRTMAGGAPRCPRRSPPDRSSSTAACRPSWRRGGTTRPRRWGRPAGGRRARRRGRGGRAPAPRGVGGGRRRVRGAGAGRAAARGPGGRGRGARRLRGGRGAG